MNNKVIYRKFKKSDLPSLVQMVIRNWKYDEMLSEKNATRLGYAFLYYALAHGQFVQVAEVNFQAVGIIVGNTQAVPFKNKLYFLQMLKHGFPLFFSKEGQMILKTYHTTVSKNRKMFEQIKTHSFDGEVALFAVSEQVQGLGIGSHLFDSFLTYLKENQGNNFFLFTDTSCNYGFYDYKKLERIATTKKWIDPLEKEMEFYIYKGVREELEHF